MLTSTQLETLTLRASAVHAHAAFPYFEHSLNRLSTETVTFPKKSSTLGEEPRLMKMPSHLNFYVRYKPRDPKAGEDDEKGCRWSKVVRVCRLAEVHQRDKEKTVSGDGASVADDANARARPRPAPLALGSQSAVSSATALDTFEWRKKTFWVCLEVEGEDEPVLLPQLSNKIPTAEEVAAYCERHARQYPSLTFTDTPLTDDAVLTRDVDLTDLRVCLPTSHQIAFLDTFWKKEFAGHAWTEAELEEAKALNRRYLPRCAGAAAGPVSATLSHLSNLTLETNLGLASSQPFQRSNMRGSHAAIRDARSSGARPGQDSARAGGSQSQGFMHLHTASSPLLWTQASASSTFADTQPDTLLGRDPFIESGHGDDKDAEDDTRPSTQILAPQTETLSQQLQQQQQQRTDLLHAETGVPRSPFLPRKRLRAHSRAEESGYSQTNLSAAASSSSGFFSSPMLVAAPGAAGSPPLHTPAPLSSHTYPVSSMELLGGSQSNMNETPAASHVPSSLSPPPPSSVSLSQAELRAWEDARQSEGMFYQYVTNTDRSRFINMLANITQRNMEANRRTRLIGIENEKKRGHRMGFEETALATVRGDEVPSAAAAADEEPAHDTTEREAEGEQAPEEDPVEKALAAFDAQADKEFSFETVPDDFFALGEAGAVESADTESPPRTRLRRTGMNPNRLVLGDAEKQDRALVCSQLVHRSASKMAQSYSQSSS